jgi:hypothetical protein
MEKDIDGLNNVSQGDTSISLVISISDDPTIPGCIASLSVGRVFVCMGDPQIGVSSPVLGAGLVGADVRTLLVAARSGQSTLHRCNLPEVNSLRDPTGIKDLFPGLQVIERLEVETIGIVELLDQVGLDASADNSLTINIPGEEAEILSALDASGRLTQFRWIALSVGRFPLYVGAVDVPELVERMRVSGFDLAEESKEEDPDRPLLVFQRNELVLRLRDVEQRVATANERLLESQAKIEELSRELEAATRLREQEALAHTDSLHGKDAEIDLLREAVSAKAAELETQEKITQRQVQQVDALSKQLAGQAERVNQARAETAGLIEKLKAAEQALASQAEVHAKTVREKDKELARLNRVAEENQQKLARLTSLEKTLQEQKAEIERLHRTIADKETEIKEHREAAQNSSRQLGASRKQFNVQSETVAELRKQAAELEDKLVAAEHSLAEQADAHATVLSEKDEKLIRLNNVLSEKTASLEGEKEGLSIALTRERELAESRREEIEKLQKLLADAQERSDQSVKRISDMEAENKEKHMRQEMMNREIDRAEAQIDLIKEIVLRDVGI